MTAGRNNKKKPTKTPVTGLFPSLKAADRAARGLIALGLTEDQIEILDRTRLIVEYNPEFNSQMAVGKAALGLSEVDDDLSQALGRKIANTIDLPLYLVDVGVPENAASYYADKIRAGFVLLLATPDKEHLPETKRLLGEMRLQQPDISNVSNV